MLKGLLPMLAKFSIRPLVAGFVVLILLTNLALSDLLANNPENNQLPAATSRFAFKLYNQVQKQPVDKNTFISPASVMLALAMTYNGANGKTREAMAQALELQGMSVDEVNRAFADLKTALDSTDPRIKLNIANSLWARNGFALKPAFVQRSKDAFEAEVTSLDFANPAAAQTINAWVSKNTEGRIKKIVADPINDETVLFLINAIYFKGQWQSEFRKELTKPDVFKLPGGEQKQLPMMSQSGSYLYHKGNDFQAVVLPYGKGGVSMFVFLPDENVGLDQFERNLTSENWDTWMRSFRMTPGDLMLPRFKVEWESSLNETLKALGMAEAFAPGRADFSQIADVSSGNRLYISDVRHKTWGEVNEEGTEAAAATSVVVGVTSVQVPPLRFSMKVDRPFFFAIRDNRTGVLLFMGSISNPEQVE
jgi:serine protease inhibitor